jgi:hypothetical protein
MTMDGTIHVWHARTQHGERGTGLCGMLLSDGEGITRHHTICIDTPCDHCHNDVGLINCRGCLIRIHDMRSLTKNTPTTDGSWKYRPMDQED